MEFGVAMFFTDYAMDARRTSRARSRSGASSSVWAPEHSHIPRLTPDAISAAASCRANTPNAWTRSFRCPSRPP